MNQHTLVVYLIYVSTAAPQFYLWSGCYCLQTAGPTAGPCLFYSKLSRVSKCLYKWVWYNWLQIFPPTAGTFLCILQVCFWEHGLPEQQMLFWETAVVFAFLPQLRMRPGPGQKWLKKNGRCGFSNPPVTHMQNKPQTPHLLSTY